MQSPSLELAKSGAFDAGGDGLADRASSSPTRSQVANPGNVTLSGVAVSDAMVSDGLAYVAGDANADGLLQVDEVWTYAGTYAITQADLRRRHGGTTRRAPTPTRARPTTVRPTCRCRRVPP